MSDHDAIGKIQGQQIAAILGELRDLALRLGLPSKYVEQIQ
jgi:hypothetical protein